MSGQKIAINRTLVGLSALVCLGIAATLLVLYPGSEEWSYWQGAFVRVGALMTAFWIALPSRKRDAAWANVSVGTLIGVILAIFGIAYRPRYAVPLIIVVVAIGFVLRPRQKGRSGNTTYRS
jgi:hypothetical protein